MPTAEVHTTPRQVPAPQATTIDVHYVRADHVELVELTTGSWLLAFGPVNFYVDAPVDAAAIAARVLTLVGEAEATEELGSR